MDMSDLQQQIFLSAEMFDRRRRENNQDQDGSEDFDAKTSMEKFLDHVMKPSQVVFSASALEKTIGARLAGYHETVASGLVECGLAQWDVFLQHCMKLISSGSYKGVLFVRQRFYDETPLRLRHSGGGGQQVITKVLQSQFRISVILQDVCSEELVCFAGFVPTWLQALQQCRATDILTAQLALESSLKSLNLASSKFDMSVQLVTTDRALVNSAAETGLRNMFPFNRKLHLPCDVHKLSTCLTHMFGIRSREISSIISYGLLFRQSGALQRFRRCIEAEIAERLHVFVGPPPTGEVQQHRFDVYDLFLASAHSNEKLKTKSGMLRMIQRTVLNYFLNGDLQDEETITWYAPFDIAREDAVLLLCKYVPRALLPAGAPIFPRHRWHGAEIPVDILGLLACHHNLLQHATRRYMATLGKDIIVDTTARVPPTSAGTADVPSDEGNQGWDAAAKWFEDPP